MLIQGGRIVTAAGEQTADVLVRGEQIVDVRRDLRADGEEVVDASGLLVLPGVVDPHTHFVLDTGTARTADDFETASRSAAAGGVTTYMDFAPQQRDQTFDQALAARLASIEGRSHVDFAIHLNITHLPQAWERDLHRLVERGVTSAKVYTTYRDTVFYVDDWLWYRLMERAGAAGFLVQVHAENDAILEGKKQELIAAGKTSLAYHAVSRPAVAEVEAVGRGLIFGRATGSPVYFVHLSTPLSLDLVGEARERGTTALTETCPHFLSLDDSVYQGPEPSRYVMAPPLRDAATREQLWDRLRRGLVHTVGSDHCGFSLAQRSGIDDFTRVSAGIPGVETSLVLLHTFGVTRKRIDLRTMVRLLSANPARIFGLWPRKGQVAAGSDADLVLFDPRPDWVLTAADLHSAAGYSPYEGLTITGKVHTTICRGTVVYRDGAVIGKPTLGQFVPCRPFDRGISLS